jgi:hypothetical protein
MCGPPNHGQRSGRKGDRLVETIFKCNFQENEEESQNSGIWVLCRALKFVKSKVSQESEIWRR